MAKERRLRREDRPPGSLVPPAGASTPCCAHVLHYGPDLLREFDAADLTAVGELSATPGVVWINVDGLGTTRFLTDLRDALGFHPLALEDVLTIGQRPKVEDYPNHLFVVLQMLTWDGNRVEKEQLSLFLCGNVVVTFQEAPGDCFEGIRQRIRRAGGQIRQQGADYLAYALVDAVVDSYFPLLEQVGAAVESLEEDLTARADETVLRRIYRLKRDLLAIRHAVWPMRDAIGRLTRDEDELLSEVVRLHLRDCHDHTVRLIDLIELNRETMASLMDVYLSVLSNRLNEVMKVLTIISTLFIPLTFLVGVYGMNFRHMPELEWTWGYAGLWAVLLAVVVVLLAYFRRKGWLGASAGGGVRARGGHPKATKGVPGGDSRGSGTGSAPREPEQAAPDTARREP